MVYNSKRIFAIKDDILYMNMKVDAVVNSANSNLTDGGGINGAIHKVAGPLLKLECMLLRVIKGKIPVGDVIVTNAYGMPCRYLFHTVGPVWKGGYDNEKQLLEKCYINALKIAKKKNCHSIVFPIISAGIFGYPIEDAIKVAILTVDAFLQKNDDIEKWYLLRRMKRCINEFLN